MFGQRFQNPATGEVKEWVLKRNWRRLGQLEAGWKVVRPGGPPSNEF